MQVTTVVGAQWGDEGKGRILDYLGGEATVAARFNGGANAGNTVQIGQETVAFRMLPACALRPNVQECYIGRGVAVDGEVLTAEVETVRRWNPGLKVYVDPRAPVVTLEHKKRDAEQEAHRPIGSTKSGIGPAYSDQVTRLGLTVEDCPLMEREDLGIHIRPFSWIEMTWRREESHLLAAGAHGVMLDINHGHYPYTTSNSCLPSAVGAGLGIDPRKVNTVVGVMKPYTTMVGRGPLQGEWNVNPYEDEKGVVTGRPRRAGYLDVPMLEYAKRVCGFDYFALTRLDVLNEPRQVGERRYDTFRVISGYLDAMGRFRVPQTRAEYESSTLEYKEFPLWTEDISNCRQLSQLPRSARLFIDWLEMHTGVPIGLISVGRERDSIIDCRPAGHGG